MGPKLRHPTVQGMFPPYARVRMFARFCLMPYGEYFSSLAVAYVNVFQRVRFPMFITLAGLHTPCVCVRACLHAGAAHGKGRGREVIAVAKSSDLVVMVLDAGKEEDSRHR